MATGFNIQAKLVLILIAFLIYQDTSHMNDTKKTNRLIESTSPYLLQHAYNPVDWHEWSEEALNKAIKEDKPILVSIGYSSCHWCHVMEKESFENPDIADIMNEYFVCIKVDREERPDVDQVYMEAVQTMGLNGGWPLNVFLTPKQQPFYGGTYFPPKNWVQLLTSIHKAYNGKRGEIESSAQKLTDQLASTDLSHLARQQQMESLNESLVSIFHNLEPKFDTVWGGMQKAPKFIMPSIWKMLLRQHYLTNNQQAIDHVILTLHRIAMGGIYDQVGGGFSRYSVDAHWFAPHFEKMLYDNAQLMSLYSEAYAVTKDEEFKTVVYETFAWLQREMTNEQGGFYSALDADSEGEEGKFYVWKQDELTALLADNAPLLLDYYSVQPNGNWEHGNNILIRNKVDSQFLKEKNISREEWSNQLEKAKAILLSARENRERPGLDDKVITAWNSMMVSGLVDTYRSFGDPAFLASAKKNIEFLEKHLINGNKIARSFKGKPSNVQGFLDDYAFTIQAYLQLYQVTFNEEYLKKGSTLLEYTLVNFYDKKDGFFFYYGEESESLITRNKEIYDNVIPASNSVMAQNLFHYGTIFDNTDWKEISKNMIERLQQGALKEPTYMSQWAMVSFEMQQALAEVVIIGEDAEAYRKEFQKEFHPFSISMGTHGKSSLPLLAEKTPLNNQTTLFVCFNNVCKRPVFTVEDAIGQLSPKLIDP